MQYLIIKTLTEHLVVSCDDCPHQTLPCSTIVVGYTQSSFWAIAAAAYTEKLSIHIYLRGTWWYTYMLTMILQTFNEVQKLLSKTNGQVVGDLMTPAPVVVRESTNLEDAARFCLYLFLQSFFILFAFFPFNFSPHAFNVRILLETKYRRLPVVDADGKLVRDRLLPLNMSYWSRFLVLLTQFLVTKVGIITRGNVVRAALHIKRASEA